MTYKQVMKKIADSKPTLDISGNTNLIGELNAIKKLLILQLVTSGVKPEDVAGVIGVSPKSVLKLANHLI